MKQFVKKMENLLKEAKAYMAKEEGKKPKESPEAHERGVKGIQTTSTNRSAGTSDMGAMVRNPSRKTHGNMKVDAAKNRVKGTIEENRKIKPSLPKAEGADEDKDLDNIPDQAESHGKVNDSMDQNKDGLVTHDEAQASTDTKADDPAFVDPSAENQADDSIPNTEEAPSEDDLENPNQPDEEQAEAPQQNSGVVYLAGDGDSIGAKVGQAMLHDDDEGLKAVSGKINQGQDLFAQWLAAAGGEMISAGGDEFVAKIPALDMNSLEEFRQQYAAAVGATLTIGTGATMSEAGKALIYGKLNGKDQVAPFDASIDGYLQQIHSGQNEEGSEEQKQDEHYIGSLYDGQDDSQEQMPIDEQAAPEMEQPEMDEALPVGDGKAPSMEDAQAASNEEMPEQDAPEMDEDQDPSIQKDDEAENDNEASDEELPSDEDVEAFRAQQNDPSMDEEVPGEDSGEIPEQDAANTDPSVASGDALDQDMAIDGEDGSDNAIESTMADSMQDGNGDYLKSQMMNVLQGFKRDKEFITQLQTSDPETYQEIIGLLHQMIKVSKILNQSAAPQDPNQQPMDEAAQPQEEQAPPMMVEAPEEPQQ
jgi:hypothetical protein